MILPFRFTTSDVAAVKKALRARYGQIKSSHADEAIAASFGFKSYAAMLATLRQAGASNRLVVHASLLLLVLRLEELGYRDIEPWPLLKLLSQAGDPGDWLPDDLRRFREERRRPVAANSQ